MRRVSPFKAVPEPASDAFSLDGSLAGHAEFLSAHDGGYALKLRFGAGVELVHDHGESEVGRVALADQTRSRLCLAASFGPVVYDENTIFGTKDPLHAEVLTLAAVVLRGRRDGHFRSREQPVAFASGDESGARLLSDRTAEQESPRLDPDNVADRCVTPRFNQSVEQQAERPGVGEQAPDVRVPISPREVAQDRASSKLVHPTDGASTAGL